MEPTIIQKRIHEIRGYKVMLDFDLAELYEVETKRLNEQVKRNIYRFPRDFMFQLTINELRAMMSQFATSSMKKRKRSATPFAFTEHGITMLSSVLNSDKAIQMNIEIVRAFNALRKFAINYKNLDDKINELCQKVAGHNVQLSEIYETLGVILKDREELQSWNDRERIGYKK